MAGTSLHSRMDRVHDTLESLESLYAKHQVEKAYAEKLSLHRSIQANIAMLQTQLGEVFDAIRSEKLPMLISSINIELWLENWINYFSVAQITYEAQHGMVTSSLMNAEDQLIQILRAEKARVKEITDSLIDNPIKDEVVKYAEILRNIVDIASRDLEPNAKANIFNYLVARLIALEAANSDGPLQAGMRPNEMLRMQAIAAMPQLLREKLVAASGRLFELLKHDPAISIAVKRLIKTCAWLNKHVQENRLPAVLLSTATTKDLNRMREKFADAELPQPNTNETSVAYRGRLEDYVVNREKFKQVDEEFDSRKYDPPPTRKDRSLTL